MNRRGFLGALFGGGAAALALDPEKLLWRPGAKLISIPAIRPPSLKEIIICSTSVIDIENVKLSMGDYIPSAFVFPQEARCPVR